MEFYQYSFFIPANGVASVGEDGIIAYLMKPSLEQDHTLSADSPPDDSFATLELALSGAGFLISNWCFSSPWRRSENYTRTIAITPVASNGRSERQLHRRDMADLYIAPSPSVLGLQRHFLHLDCIEETERLIGSGKTGTADFLMLPWRHHLSIPGGDGLEKLSYAMEDRTESSKRSCGSQRGSFAKAERLRATEDSTGLPFVPIIASTPGRL